MQHGITQPRLLHRQNCAQTCNKQRSVLIQLSELFLNFSGALIFIPFRTHLLKVFGLLLRRWILIARSFSTSITCRKHTLNLLFVVCCAGLNQCYISTFGSISAWNLIAAGQPVSFWGPRSCDSNYLNVNNDCLFQFHKEIESHAWLKRDSKDAYKYLFVLFEVCVNGASILIRQLWKQVM